MSENYYKQFLGEDNPVEKVLKSESKQPEWVSFHPTAKKAYEAINELKNIKLRYIKGHTKKTHFSKKSLWCITKSEVANRLEVKPQPLFNSNTFSLGLAKYYDEVVQYLKLEVDKQLSKKKKGLQHRTKSELKESTIDLNSRLDNLQKANCEYLFQQLLDGIPLDIKRKLGLY
ncbi:hypothetical protein [Vibrio salinus]|uniref:hypothetical protein n=1 Tax=Vibrio salinus TaxID=2899784 RepID=UPI001E53BCDF|nr:hypothetical protein [Vibrio salinus]MCE0494650.1 hypothetical protein [Vibrio salinus]